MRIKIITGTTYGYRDSSGRLDPKTSASGDFDVSADEGMRLVSIGVAAEAVATSTERSDRSGLENNSSCESEGPDKTQSGHISYEQLCSMDMPNLKKLALDMDINIDGLTEAEDIAKRISDVSVMYDGTPKYSMKNSADELAKMLTDIGAASQTGMKKADMIAELDKFYAGGADSDGGNIVT